MQLLKQLRQGNFVINEFLAASDITAATAAALATRNVQVGYGPYADAWFVKIFNGAYYMVDRAVNSLPMSGRVPVSLFQLLAAIRSRPVELSAGRGFTLNVSLSQTGTPTSPTYLPPIGSVPDQRAGFSELMQCYAQLGGVLVDLNELCDSGELNLGKLGKVSFGKSLGPLNLGNGNATVGNIDIIRICQQYPVSETWMKYVDWLFALPTGIYFDYDTDSLKFPYQTGSVLPYAQTIRPANVILCRSFSNAAVLQCTKFDFPVMDLPQLAACIEADAIARGITIAPSTDFTLGAYLLASRIGVESGILGYVPTLFQQTNFQLPQVLCEAVTVTGSYRNGQARLPLPVAGTLNNDSELVYNIALAQPQSDTNVIVDSNGYAGWIHPQSGFLLIGQSYISNSGSLVAWGTPPTSGGSIVPFNYGAFSKTIGFGPLGQPGVDKSVGRLNMNDLFAEYSINTTTDVVGIVSVCSNGKRVQDIDFKLLSLFPLMKPFFYTVVPADPSGTAVLIGEETPQRREILNLPNPVINYVNAAVTEGGAAKYTELQMFIQDLNEKGLGGNSLIGDLTSGFGNILKGASKIAGLGHPTAGKILEVGSDLLLSYEGHQNKGVQVQARTNAPKVRVNKRPVTQKSKKTTKVRSGGLNRNIAVTRSKRAR